MFAWITCFFPWWSVNLQVSSSTEAETICSREWDAGNVRSSSLISDLSTARHAITRFNDSLSLFTLYFPYIDDWGRTGKDWRKYKFQFQPQGPFYDDRNRRVPFKVKFNRNSRGWIFLFLEAQKQPSTQWKWLSWKDARVVFNSFELPGHYTNW